MSTLWFQDRCQQQGLSYRSPLLLGQIAIFLIFIVAVALIPSARGPMLLIPLRQGSAATIDLALARGGSLLALGPVRNSVIVEGDRDRLAWDMLANGTLVLAASPVICGTLSVSGPVSGERS